MIKYIITFFVGVITTLSVAYFKMQGVSNLNLNLELANYAFNFAKITSVLVIAALALIFVLAMIYAVFRLVLDYFDEAKEKHLEKLNDLEKEIIENANQKAKEITTKIEEKEIYINNLKEQAENDYRRLIEKAQEKLNAVLIREEELERKKEAYLEELRNLEIKNKRLKGFLKNSWKAYLRDIEKENEGRAKRTKKKLNKIYTEFLE